MRHIDRNPTTMTHRTPQPVSVRYTPAAACDDADDLMDDFVVVSEEMLQDLALQQDPASLFYRATSDGVTHV